MSKQDGQKIDFASVFPSKGDSRRPPDWWGRGLLYAAIAVFLSVFVWQSWAKVSFIVFDVVIAIFLALAIEPLIIRLVRHGWRRGVAAGVSLAGLLVIIVALLGLFGNMFVQQVISMVSGLPELYDQIAAVVAQYTTFNLPKIESLGAEILKNLQTSWVTDFAGQALNTTLGLFSFLLNLITIIMVTFYISAAGPRMRRAMCQWLGEETQRRFLLGWTIVQEQISGFLFSRTILAAINAVCMVVFLEIIHVPYWLPLALFCGITSQFIPTIGTYIGGALPIVFAWGSNGLGPAVAVLIFIIVYQQIENTILSPKISQRTMNLNPAIAFLAVLVLGAIFGALGAFLALPVTASLQAVFKVYTKRYELVDSPLMFDPKPVKKSKVVEGAEAISERVVKTVGNHIPRAIKGSSARVSTSVDDEYADIRRQLFEQGDDEDADDSRTIAIPKSNRQGAKLSTAVPTEHPAPTENAVPTEKVVPTENAAPTEHADEHGDDDSPNKDSPSGDGSKSPRSRWH